MPFLIAGCVLLILAFVALGAAFYCYRRVFYLSPTPILAEDEFDLPQGDCYLPFHERMLAWMKETRALPHETVEITSFDGLTLRGKLYEYEKGAPIEILFHGYKGTSERDLCGGAQRCFALKRNTLIVDQRGSGLSEGHTTSFGILERKDCLRWVDYLIERFGKDVKIILGGISMGAATVLMAAGEEDLPKNVQYVVGDCSYSSPKEIICKTVKEMGLPPSLVYPFIKLGAKIFGKFNLEETSPLQAMARCSVPVILLHGDADDFVPVEMSQRLYEACASKKKLVIVEGADHGLAYPKDVDAYVNALKEFEKECGV